MKINPEVLKIKKTIIETRRDIHKHPELSFQEIAEHAEQQMVLGVFKEGYRKGVRIIDVDASLTHEFMCPFVRIDAKTKLLAKHVQRREGEKYYIQIRAKSGELLRAGKVELILYHHDVLSENGFISFDESGKLITFKIDK